MNTTLLKKELRRFLVNPVKPLLCLIPLIALIIPFGCTIDDPGFYTSTADSKMQVVDSDGDIISVESTTGALRVEDYQLEAARGEIAGVSTYNKFGRNIEIDSGVTADIWDGGYTLVSGGVSLIWVAPTAARIHDIASTSGNDDGDPGGTGARTIRIFGLTGWNVSEVNEDIVMDGGNDVATSNAYVIIYRMIVLTKGGANINVGTITATAQGDGTITAQIRIGQGQTQMVIFGIPSTQTVYMGRLYANVNKAGGAAALVDVSLLYNPEPDAELTNFLTKHTFGLQTVGTSAFTIPYYVPKVFPGPGILKVQIQSSTNDMDVSAGFDLIIVDN